MKERRSGASRRKEAPNQNMKAIRKLMSFLTIICCLAGSLAPLYAEASEEVPRIVFTNEPKDSPDLTVTKDVVSQTSLPETEQGREFTFYLMLDGKAARNMIYHKYDQNGTEVFDGDITVAGIVVGKENFATGSSDGSFTLQDGYSAKFLSEESDGLLGKGTRCEIIEDLTDLPRYTQTKPEGGASALIPNMPVNGKTVAFENTYGGTKKAGLEVQKRVLPMSFDGGQDDYPIPDSMMPEQGFPFLLKIENKVAAHEPYTLIKGDTGAQQAGATNADGLFWLEDGDKAVFTGEKIKAGVDYEVMEVDLPQDWRAAGTYRVSNPNETVEIVDQNRVKHTYKVAARDAGNTKDGAKSCFENALASFAVSKRMRDGSTPETDFTFELTNEDHALWPNAKYFVYNIRTKELVRDKIGDAERDYHTTSDKGLFTLKPGQIAIFFGFSHNDKYNVREIKVAGEQETDSPEETDTGTKSDQVQVSGTDQKTGDGETTGGGSGQGTGNGETTGEGSGQGTGNGETTGDGSGQGTGNGETTGEGSGQGTGNVASTGGGSTQDQKPQYTQVMPAKLSGYRNQTVTDALIELPFENKLSPGGLTVTKTVVNESGEAPFDPDVKFKFILYRIEEGKDPILQTEKEYIVELEGEEFKTNTDETDGSFFLAENQTATFTDLEPGTYMVTEDVTDTPEYSVVPEAPEGNSQKTISQTKVLADGQNANFVFTNYYNPKRLDLRIKKVDPDGKPLKGVEFELYRNAELTNAVAYTAGRDGAEPESRLNNGDRIDSDSSLNNEDGIQYGDIGNTQPDDPDDTQSRSDGTKDDAPDDPKTDPEPEKVRYTAATDKDGIITFENLKPGTYYLKETKSVGGYLILPKEITIVVTRGADGLQATVEGGRYDKKDPDPIGPIQVDNVKNQVEITVINTKLYELPSAGGRGIYWYMIGGVLLMMAAALILYKNKGMREVPED